MDKFHVRLQKDAKGYGLAIIAMGVDPEIERLGIYVKSVLPGRSADKAGMPNNVSGGTFHLPTKFRNQDGGSNCGGERHLARRRHTPVCC